MKAAHRFAARLLLAAAPLLMLGHSAPGDPPADAIAVVVNKNLKPLIQTNLDLYIADVTADGFAPVVKEWDMTQPDQNEAGELRDYLKTVTDLKGAVFIGDVPVKQYENSNDWESAYALFPFDLYFMDLNVTWLDIDSDGYIDGPASSGISPNIWVSRIKSSGISAFSGKTEPDLVNRYLEKVHRFRTGDLVLPYRGLLWADTDWKGTAPSSNVGYCYTNTTRVTEAVAGITTDKTDWMNRWRQAYEFEQFMCHSGVTTHYPGGSSLSYTEVASSDICRLFWNCWNCSSAKYTSANYVAGVRLYTPLYGLISVGSTKTGSMYPQYTFYSQLNTGKCFGESFRAWFAVFYSDVPWNRGMTLLGDGTLKLGRFVHTSHPGDQAPTITPISNVSVAEDAVSAPITFTIGDDLTPASNMVVWAETTNRTLLPAYNIGYGGTDTNRYITVQGLANQTGSVYVVVVVCDGQNTNAAGFTATFTNVNDNPSCSMTGPTDDNDVFYHGAPIPLNASATDVEGNATVTHVDFFLDGSNICSDPYNGNTAYTGVTEVLSLGTHPLFARAYDSSGGVGSSPSVNLRIIEPLTGSWANADIGTPGCPGISGLDGADFLVAGGGDITGTNDRFQFCCLQLSNDVEITAQIADFENTDADAKCGVMVRSSLSAGSPYVFGKIRYSGYRTRLQYRASEAGTASSGVESANLTLPQWIKLVKEGPIFTGSYSSNGITWKSMGSVTNPMPETFYVGLASAARDNADLCNAQYAGVESLCFPPDVDEDGIPNWQDTDDDGDLMPDAWEQAAGLNFRDASDAFGDADGDKFLNWQEYFANTGPTNPASALRIVALSNMPNVVLCFLGVTGRTYSVEYCTNMLFTNAWMTLSSNVTGNGTISVTDTNALAPSKFYRIRTALP